MSNKNILLIEDDPFIKQMYVNKIEETQIKVFAVLDQDEIDTILDKNSIDLILLDLILPNISGFELLKLLKNKSQTQYIPIIVLSNLSSQKDIDQAFKLGANDYIVKSNYTPTEVMRIVQEYLS